MRVHDRLNGLCVGARVRRTALRGVLLALVVAGCDRLTPVAPYTPTTDPAQLFLSLTLDHRTITMSTLAPYDTLQLTAMPRDGTGAPMTGLPAPTFTSSDTTAVRVTPGGLLQARAAGSALIIAEIRADGNVRQADTAYVTVTADVTAPPRLATFSIEPLTPQDAVWAMTPEQGATGAALIFFATQQWPFPRLTPRILDAQGNPMPWVPVEYESLDPDIVLVYPRDPALYPPQQPGTARIVMRATVYGVTMADTAHFTVTAPYIHGVIVRPSASGGPPDVAPKTPTIRAGGYVFFTNETADSVRVTFDDPASAGPTDVVCSAFGGGFCGAGNIPNFMSTDTVTFGPSGNPLENTRGRQFTTPGTYAFHIEPLGVTGHIIVVPFTMP